MNKRAAAQMRCRGRTTRSTGTQMGRSPSTWAWRCRSGCLRPTARLRPLLLIGLVSLCILLPLVLMACFLANSNKYMGSGGVMAETLDIFVRWGAPALQGIACWKAQQQRILLLAVHLYWCCCPPFAFGGASIAKASGFSV